jgi:hypothetical protein
MNIHRICSTYIKTSRRMSVLRDADKDGSWLSYLRISRDMSMTCYHYWSLIAETSVDNGVSLVSLMNKVSDVRYDHVI